VARSRNIKPGFCQNEHLAQLPFETRLLFALLPCFADRDGRMEDRPQKIKMQVFPADNIDTEPMLQALHDRGFIDRYIINDCQYIQIVNFTKHQNPHIKEQASTIPAPCKHHASTVQDTTKAHTSHADSFNPITDSFQEQAAEIPENGKTKPRKPKKTGKRLPKNWQPSKELLTWAMTERKDLDMQKVIDSFTDYWIAKTGSAATKLDWDATFRNWVRNEKSNRSQQSRNGQRETPVQRSERLENEALAATGL